MNTPPIVSPQEWEAAREQLLVKEKAMTRARDVHRLCHVEQSRRHREPREQAA